MTPNHPPGSAVIALSVRTVSESNGRDHWAKKARRVKNQRFTAAAWTRSHLTRPLPVIVTLVRVAPRALDDDNLRGALKAIRDGVADGLGVDDRDPRVTWVYLQRRGAPGSYQVEIGIRAAAEPKDVPGAA